MSISRYAWQDFLGFTQKPPWEAREADNADELLRMLDVLGMAATRTGNLRRILKNVEGDEMDEWTRARDEAIKKLTEEWDLKSTIS